MTDEELVSEYVRVTTTGEAIVVSAMKVSWDGPHTPVSTWETKIQLPCGATDDEIQAAVEKTLGDKRFFQVCPECSRANSRAT